MKRLKRVDVLFLLAGLLLLIHGFISVTLEPSEPVRLLKTVISFYPQILTSYPKSKTPYIAVRGLKLDKSLSKLI